MEQRVQRKNYSVKLIGLSWAFISGVLLYFTLNTVNLFTLYVILGLIAFVIYLLAGFFLKAPALLIYNCLIYPLGIIVASLLNILSSKWTFEPNPLGFVFTNFFGLLVFYLFISIVGFYLLRSITGYEITQPNPIISFNYSLRADNDDYIELLEKYLLLYKDVTPEKKIKSNRTSIDFIIKPNRYSVIFTHKKDREYEVNILAYQMRSDILCEADKEKAEITSAVINTLFSIWKEQGHIDYWIENKNPEFNEQLRKDLVEKIGNGKFPFPITTIKQVKFFTSDWLKQNKKEIVKYIIVAILSPIIIYFITQLFE